MGPAFLAGFGHWNYWAKGMGEGRGNARNQTQQNIITHIFFSSSLLGFSPASYFTANSEGDCSLLFSFAGARVLRVCHRRMCTTLFARLSEGLKGFVPAGK